MFLDTHQDTFTYAVAPAVVAHAWNAQKRLHKRFWHLARRKNRQKWR